MIQKGKVVVIIYTKPAFKCKVFHEHQADIIPRIWQLIPSKSSPIVHWFFIINKKTTHTGLVWHFHDLLPFLPFHGQPSGHGKYILIHLKCNAIYGDLMISPPIHELESIILIISNHHLHIRKKSPLL